MCLQWRCNQTELCCHFFRWSKHSKKTDSCCQLRSSWRLTTVGFIVTLARMRSKGRFKMGLFAFVSPIARLPQFRWFRVIRLTSILVMTHAWPFYWISFASWISNIEVPLPKHSFFSLFFCSIYSNPASKTCFSNLAKEMQLDSQRFFPLCHKIWCEKFKYRKRRKNAVSLSHKISRIFLFCFVPLCINHVALRYMSLGVLCTAIFINYTLWKSAKSSAVYTIKVSLIGFEQLIVAW